MSDGPLLHFTKDSNLEEILRGGALLPGDKSFGVYPIPAKVNHLHRSVCLSEMSFEHAQKLAAQHGRWGIAFKRDRIIAAGAKKVKYLKEPELSRIKQEQQAHREDPEADLWTETPFMSPVLDGYSFEWEQEWRMQGGFEFSWDDIEYLISPDGGKLKMVPDGNLGNVYQVVDQDGIEGPLEWEDGESEPFNRVMRGVVSTLFEGYIDPHQVLFYSDDDYTGYEWGTFSKWDAWSILADKVPPMPDAVVNDLLQEFDSRAIYWVSAEEYNSIHL